MLAGNQNMLLSSDSGYAQRCKELLALVKQLRAIGAQADLDLPRIAVIGNQSAGKSSLVEAISGITVPRDAGTCTRCPMECRLQSSSDAWSCQVSIRWEFDANNKRNTVVYEAPFGSLITNKDEVELVLRRAQAAVLHPDIPADKFLSLTAAQLSKDLGFQERPLPFSRNVVCVDLAGPDLTDLSFVDLPGIISNADSKTVAFVENLVKSHIQGNCLILVTLPMNDDIDNAKGAWLAAEQDPSGLRTIGVMTKPDTIPSGATKQRELWLDVLEGRSRPLTHGYYCTRQLDEEDRRRGISAEEARAAEAAFFASTAPWRDSTHTDRFGTHNLVRNLSKLLTQIIDDSLPKLQEEVTGQLAQCNARLEVLPPRVTTEPSAYVLSLVTAFCGDVLSYVQGGSNTASLVQGNRKAYTAFKYAIRGTAPAFSPYPSAQDAGGDVVDFFDIQDDDEEELPAGMAVAQPKVVYLQDVKRFIQQSVTRELPNNVPYPAKVTLIRQFQKPWAGFVRTCFDAVDEELQRTLQKLVKENFTRYEPLRARIAMIIVELVKVQREATVARLLEILKYETTPFTLNSHYLAEKIDKELARYKDARARQVAPEPAAPFGASTGAFSQFVPLQPPKVFGPPMTPTQSNGSTPGFGATQKETPFSFARPANAAPAQSAPFSFGGGAEGEGSSKRPAPAPWGEPNALSAPGEKPAASPSTPVSRTPIPTPAPKPVPLPAPPADSEEMRKLLAGLKLFGYNVTPDDLGKLHPPDEYEEEMQVMAEVRGYFHVAYKRLIDYVPLAIDHQFLYAFAEGLQAFLIARLELGTPSAPARCAAFLAEPANVVARREELMGRKKRLEGVQTELFNFGL